MRDINLFIILVVIMQKQIGKLIPVIPNTRNFIGLEINKNVNKEIFSMVLRPQMRVALNNSTVLGMLVGVPTNTKHEGFSGFIRLIYEPPHKKKK